MSRYLVFYKPYRVLCQFTDDEPPTTGPRSTLKDFIDVPEVYAAGRLDWDSEGLLLLTDDGPLIHRLLTPNFGHPRTYWVQVEHEPTPAAIDHLAQGVMIQGQRTRPAQVHRLDPEPDLPPRDPPIRDRQAIPTAWLALTLTEGRNRQVRRMTAAVSHPTLRLVRWALGDLTLAGLVPGQWRDLGRSEVEALKRSLGQTTLGKPRLGQVGLGRVGRSPRAVPRNSGRL